MSSLNDPNMIRAVIMDHYSHPRNKNDAPDETYTKIHMDSDSCTDDFYVYLKMNGNIIEDVCFNGIGCTISTSSLSIMTELVKGKTKEEAMNIINNFYKMIDHNHEYDEDVLEEANVFENTYKQANRIKCATIGWHGLEQLLEGDSSVENYEKKDEK